jgi:serine protease Do
MARIGELKEEIASDKPGEKPNQKRNSSAVVNLDGLGLALSLANKSLRKKFSIEKDINGVIVVGVVADGVASQMGVRIGDVIVEVDQNTITEPSEIVAIIGNVVKKGKKKSVLFTVNRQGSIRFIGLKLK